MSGLPTGWTETEIGQIAQIETGSTPSKKNASLYGREVCFYKPGDLDIGGVISISNDMVSKAGAEAGRILPANSLLVTCIGNLGKSALIAEPAICNQQINAVIPSRALEPHYLYYWSRTIKAWLEENSSATTVSIINKGRFSKAPIRIAPINEQRRIVAKIDSLTGKSKRARDHLDHIPRLVEKYKQAILAAAFRGDLTREFTNADKPNKTEIDAWKQALCVRLNNRSWKVSNEVPEVYEGAPARWLRCYIADVVAHRSGVAFKSGDFSETGIQVIRLGNLYNGVFDLSRNPVFLKNADQYGAFVGEAGDVLVAQTGTRFKRDYGHFIVLKESHRGVLVNQRIACLTATEALNPYFLKFFSHLSSFKDHFFSHETGGVNQGNVGLAGIMDAPIALPNRIEQDAIVNRLHAAFSWIERLAADADSARKLIDHLDQAVLAKAFKGELVPQDPADEPASILLESVRTERAAAPKPKRGRKKEA